MIINLLTGMYVGASLSHTVTMCMIPAGDAPGVSLNLFSNYKNKREFSANS